MLSLANRILSSPIDRPLAMGAQVQGKIDAEKKLILASQKIRLDNVASYYADHEQAEWDFHDIPNWAPPFSNFWMEWNWPKHINNAAPDQVEFEKKFPNATSQGGAFVMAFPFTEQNRADVIGWRHLTSRALGFAEKWFPPEQNERIEKACSEAKWAMITSPWQWSNVGRCLPIWTGHIGAMFIGARGSYVTSLVTAQTQDSFPWSWFHIIGLGISFMHCKNVRQVESKDESGSQRFREQYKIPKFRYRTLLLDPMKEVLRREGQSETQGLKRALHICRGHFSTYSDEKPLFGKYAGTFWIPDHVRGKKEYGEVQKDYDVMPANGEGR